MSSFMQNPYNIPEKTDTARRYTILVYLMLALAFAVVTRPGIHGNDGVQNYAYLRSVMFDGDLNFANEYEYFISRQADWFDRKQIPRDPVTNMPINLYGVGSSMLWAPWVLAAHTVGTVMQKLGANVQLNGYSYLYAVGVSYGSAFYATLALALLFRKLKQLAGYLPASWALLLIWLASPLFFYMYLHPSMSHANSFFLVTMVLLQYLSRPTTARRWALLGATCGLMTITRYQDGILMTAMIVGELWDFKHTESRFRGWIRQRLPLYAAWLAAFLITLIPQILAWGILQGSYFSGPRAYIHQGDFSLLAPVYAPEVLFSSQHGLFYWHPALLIAFGGLLVGGVFLREKLMCLSAFAAQTWVVASWSIWWAGASFGHRMFISTLPFLAIGALFSVGRPGKAGTALRVMLLILIVWNFGLIVQYGLGWISRQEGVPFTEMVYNNFVRLPGLIIERLRL